MSEYSLLAIVISAGALLVSLITTWVTLFRHGTLLMTQPTNLMLGPDGPNHAGPPKVHLRTLIYSSAKRGHVIENMFVRLLRGEHRQNFPIWVLGDQTLARGSGLFVGDQGVVANHHFLLPFDTEGYVFKAGEYQIEVVARLVGEKNARRLWSQTLTISQDDARRLLQPNNAIYFDWGPDSNRYSSRILSLPPKPMPSATLEVSSTLPPESESTSTRK